MPFGNPLIQYFYDALFCNSSLVGCEKTWRWIVHCYKGIWVLLFIKIFYLCTTLLCLSHYYITLWLSLCTTMSLLLLHCTTLLYVYHNYYVLYIIMYYIIILLTYIQHRPPIILRLRANTPEFIPPALFSPGNCSFYSRQWRQSCDTSLLASPALPVPGQRHLFEGCSML